MWAANGNSSSLQAWHALCFLIAATSLDATRLMAGMQAYGEKGYGEIPPGATLDIEVQLLSIKTSPFGSRVKIVEG